MLARLSIFLILLVANFAMAKECETSPRVTRQNSKSLTELRNSLSVLETPSGKMSLKSACAKQESFKKSKYAQRKSSAEILERAAKSPSKVIFFGESHAEKSDTFYPWALKELKKNRPNLNCLFIEQADVGPEAKQEVLDRCVAGPRVLKNDVLRCGEGKGKLDYWATAVNAAAEQGIKIYGIDTRSGGFTPNVEGRNAYMAARIEKLMGQECDSAVAILGSRHLDKFRTGSKTTSPSVREQIESKGISSHSILLGIPNAKASKGHAADVRWNWNSDEKMLCRTTAVDALENYGFEITKDEARDFPMMLDASTTPDHQFEGAGSWSNHDAGIMIGCSDPLKSRCD